MPISVLPSVILIEISEFLESLFPHLGKEGVSYFSLLPRATMKKKVHTVPQHF